MMATSAFRPPTSNLTELEETFLVCFAAEARAELVDMRKHACWGCYLFAKKKHTCGGAVTPNDVHRYLLRCLQRTAETRRSLVCFCLASSAWLLLWTLDQSGCLQVVQRLRRSLDGRVDALRLFETYDPFERVGIIAVLLELLVNRFLATICAFLLVVSRDGVFLGSGPARLPVVPHGAPALDEDAGAGEAAEAAAPRPPAAPGQHQRGRRLPAARRPPPFAVLCRAGCQETKGLSLSLLCLFCPLVGLRFVILFRRPRRRTSRWTSDTPCFVFPSRESLLTVICSRSDFCCHFVLTFVFTLF